MSNKQKPEEETETPPPTKTLIKAAWRELNDCYRKYGRKRSIQFCDAHNVSKLPHRVMHKMIKRLGGWHRIDRIFVMIKDTSIDLDKIPLCPLFDIEYRHFWNNEGKYDHVEYCTGLFEVQSGRCTQLINSKTGKHIFSGCQTL